MLYFYSSFSRYHTSKGIPFYMNSLKDIVKRCIGNPVIASSIASNPTLERDYVRLAVHYGVLAFLPIIIICL